MKPLHVFMFVLSPMFLLTSCHTSKSTVPAVEDIGVKKPALDIQVQVRLAELDNLGHLYIVDQKNRIIHLLPSLKEAYSYANNRSGLISSLDTGNPLQILAFYDDFNQVKILDNTLSVIREMSLDNVSTDISACGMSNDGNIWAFDPVRLRLVKVGTDGTVISESSNLADVGMAGCQITSIREKGNVVLLCDPARGFYFFDNLGQYTYHFPVSDVLTFQFDGRFVTYYTPTGLKRYSLVFKDRTILGYPLDLVHTTLKFVLMDKDTFFAVYSDGIIRRTVNGKD